jgi:hypothetical protein
MINGIRMIAVIFYLLRNKGGLKDIAYAGEITVYYNHGNLFNLINLGSDK